MENVSTEVITPQFATVLLSNNKHNRPVHRRHLDKIAAAMAEGRWQFNGESIKISPEGYLVDGQHRLFACVKSGVSFKTLVVRNVPLDTFTTIDIGTKRTSSDALGRAGVKNATTVASAIRWVKAIETGKAHVGNIILDPDQTIAEFSRLKELENSAELTQLIKLATPALCAALHFHFSLKNKYEADAFFNDLRSGEGLQSGDPVLTLRNKLIELRLSNRLKKQSSTSDMCALIIRAWNARRTGRSMSLIKGLVKNDAGELLMPKVM